MLLHIRAFSADELEYPTATLPSIEFTPGASPTNTEASDAEISADNARRRTAGNFDSTASGIASEFATASPDLNFGEESVWSGSGTTPYNFHSY